MSGTRSTSPAQVSRSQTTRRRARSTSSSQEAERQALRDQKASLDHLVPQEMRARLGIRAHPVTLDLKVRKALQVWRERLEAQERRDKTE